MIKHKTMSMTINNKECKIDIPCVKLVKFFNEQGLLTKFSCQGDNLNPFYVLFDESITDNDITQLLIQYQNNLKCNPFKGRFEKWARMVNGEIRFNWRYHVSSIYFADQDYATFIHDDENKPNLILCSDGKYRYDK